LTVWTSVPTVIVPVLGVPSGFAATVYVSAPDPPGLELVIVIQEALVVPCQAHDDVVVTNVLLDPPAAAIVRLAGDNA
jgi:hypothetical protein